MLALGVTNPLYAQEPTLVFSKLAAPSYPIVEINVECSGLGVDAQQLTFTVSENGVVQKHEAQRQPQIPVHIALLLDVSQNAGPLIQQVAKALQQFNDRCAWNEADKIALYLPQVLEQGCIVTQFSGWRNDRVDAANQLQRLATALPAYAAATSTAPDLLTFAKQIPYGDTPLYDLVDQTLDQMKVPREVHAQNVLIVFSDGINRTSHLQDATSLHQKAGQAVELYAVLLADAPLQNPGTLQALVDLERHPNRYKELGKTAPITLADLWPQIRPPNQYALTYSTSQRPPFAIEVKAITETGQKAIANQTLNIEIDPVQVQIIQPVLGAILPVTRTKAITDGVVLTLPVTAQIQVQWPAERQGRMITEIGYSIDGQAEQMLTAPAASTDSAIYTLTLAPLDIGSHTLYVRVDEGIPDLQRTDEVFFEIREQDPTIAQDILANAAAVSTFNNSLRELRWWFVSASIALLAILALLLIPLWRLGPMRDQQASIGSRLDKIDQTIRNLPVHTSLGIAPANWAVEGVQWKAALFLLAGGGLPEFIPIITEYTSLGSHEESTCRLFHRYIDQKQCVIKYDEQTESFTIFDGDGNQVSSLNGTSVTSRSSNSTNVTNTQLDEPDKGLRLKSGDVIHLGPIVKYSFRSRQILDVPSVSLPENSSIPANEIMMGLTLPGQVTKQA